MQNSHKKTVSIVSIWSFVFFCLFPFCQFVHLMSCCFVSILSVGIVRCASVAYLDAHVLILKLFCLSLLIEITKSIVGHFKAVLRGVFVIKIYVFIVIAFDRTHCHKMLIFSSIVNVSWLYSLIPAYTNFPFNYLPLISYRLLLTAYKVITNLYLHIRYHLI